MNRHMEDPFLCNDCQKLGYCRVRAIQSAIERRLMYERSTMESPILSPDPEPVPTFSEFVAVHRPDLSRLLPSRAETSPDTGAAKTPTLAELRARIAARKLTSTASKPIAEASNDEAGKTDAQHGTGNLFFPANTPASILESFAFNRAMLTCKPTPPSKPDLVRLGQKPVKHQRILTRQIKYGD